MSVSVWYSYLYVSQWWYSYLYVSVWCSYLYV